MKITKRRGRWVVDAYIHGRRVVRSFTTRRDAEDRFRQLADERRERSRPAVDPFVTVADYAPRYLQDCRDAALAPRSVRNYELMLKKHVIPKLGPCQIRDLRRLQIRTFIQSLEGQATRKAARSVLSGLLAMAMDDQIVTSNAARNLTRRRNTKARAAGKRNVKAMTQQQREQLLAAASGELYTAALLGFLAGLRGGEVLGLRWDAVDLAGRKLRIHRQLHDASPKSGKERMVDMASRLAEHLEELQARRRAEAFQAGATMSWVVSPWLPENPTETEANRARDRIRAALIRALKAADLPPHFTFHATRHTYCSLLIAAAVSPVYVAQQAGHSDVSFTVAVYGNWFPVEQPGAVDTMATGKALAEPVTKRGSTGNSATDASPQPLPPTGTCAAQAQGSALTP